MTNEQVLKVLRVFCNQHGTQKAAADALGITGAYLSDVLNGKRNPGPAILEGLGLERTDTYRKVAK